MPVFDLLRHESDIRTLTAGEVIFAEGQPGDSMFAVLDGEVAIRKNGKVLETVVLEQLLQKSHSRLRTPWGFGVDEKPRRARWLLVSS